MSKKSPKESPKNPQKIPKESPKNQAPLQQAPYFPSSGDTARRFGVRRNDTRGSMETRSFGFCETPAARSDVWSWSDILRYFGWYFGWWNFLLNRKSLLAKTFIVFRLIDWPVFFRASPAQMFCHINHPPGRTCMVWSKPEPLSSQKLTALHEKFGPHQLWSFSQRWRFFFFLACCGHWWDNRMFFFFFFPNV